MPFVTIIIPADVPGVEPQTINIDVSGPRRGFIIGDNAVAFLYGLNGDGETGVQGFGDGQKVPTSALSEALKAATEKISGSGLQGEQVKLPSLDKETPKEPAFTPPTEEDKQALRDMNFSEQDIENYYKQKQEEAAAAATPEAPKDPQPGVPIPDLSTLDNTEDRVAHLESLTSDEQKADLGNQKLALGLYRNAKDETRPDLVARICEWLGLPEMVVETQAPKSA